MPKTKILLTASTFPRWENDTEPEFILQLAQALSDSFRVLVLAPHCQGAASRETLGEVSVYRYRYAPAALESLAYGGGIMSNLAAKPWRWLLVPGLLLSQLNSVRKLCREENIALVHAHWIVPQGLALLLGSWLGMKFPPILITSHGADLFSLRSKPLRWLKLQILKRAQRVNVVSTAMLKETAALGLDNDKVFVRSMGVDLQHRFVDTTPWEQRSGLIFVGRLVEKKGVATLIRAISLLTPRYPNLQLNIIGDGPLRASLQALATTLGCAGNITFAGAIPNQKIPALLNQHRIALVPSVIARDGDQEGLGLVAVEAMGCGCAVICSDLPALGDVVEQGKTGILVTPGDSEALASAILDLLRDDELCTGLATNGKQSALARFDWPGVAAEYAKQYAQLCQAEANNSPR
ncbi:MAG: glycosyltransferase [Halieaceae bacterium]